jgi:hypothetical protein
VVDGQPPARNQREAREAGKELIAYLRDLKKKDWARWEGEVGRIAHERHPD